MKTITLKNVPDELHQRLKERAKRHRRSMNGEAIACLEQVLGAQETDPEEILRRAREFRSRVGFRLTHEQFKRFKEMGRP